MLQSHALDLDAHDAEDAPRCCMKTVHTASGLTQCASEN
jgi:hypothetical protein